MNDRERDVLDILWNHNEPMTATDIVNAGKGLTQSTVTTVLRNLLYAKYVEVTGITHSGKVLSRQYRPTEASKNAVVDYILAELERSKNIVTLEELYKIQQERTR